MKQLLLALALIALPVGAFSLFHVYFGVSSTPTATASLGDLSSFKTIVADAETIVAKGDLVAAEKRMTDFETSWDAAQPQLRALNSAAWGAIDDAHDVALKALRTGSPVAEKVSAALTTLARTLENPIQSATAAPSGGAVATIGGVKITDDNGRPLPCEEMLKAYRAEMATAKLSDADKPKIEELLAKGVERCNADDDKRAGEFFGQGLALMRR
mgnify:CR=1 FL=1